MPRARLARSLVARLLAWYEAEARDLPWRRTSDPYAILVSEVMLQQTRVETVTSYYTRFLGAYPTVRALARASIDDVLKQWEGLGYYRRAHNLHRAAREITARHGGNVPADVAALRALPGIGPYTAAAVVSIAFGGDEPVLDGNVIRVVSRLFRVPGDPARAATRLALGACARSLISPGRCGPLNQALMDLGARVCVPRNPRCAECPVAADCEAHRAGEEGRFPERAARRPIPHRDVVAGVVWQKGHERSAPGAKVLLAQREAGDMLGGLWEFPGGTVEEGETLEEALARELHEELGIDVAVGPFLAVVEHGYSHFRMSLHAFHCRHIRGRPRPLGCAAFEWVEPVDIARYALSVADQRIARALAKESARSD
jgi:A/G-specific adenine glycosylase